MPGVKEPPQSNTTPQPRPTVDHPLEPYIYVNWCSEPGRTGAPHAHPPTPPKPSGEKPRTHDRQTTHCSTDPGKTRAAGHTPATPPNPPVHPVRPAQPPRDSPLGTPNTGAPARDSNAIPKHHGPATRP
ncbi:acidic proline-rich protein PRP25-like [Dunckerocampus dactyliophorus]|uniref:acidic proline-rich protein PRP25-like n=1 Tax=Dunckerocampus dactyliophorus TaxID=161453 RepID=UPI002405D4EC|nr:acidic proline-rich protein PRP25-like [Dunckerocampus dactyliophorus]